MPIITIKMKERRSAVRVHQTSITERIQSIFPRIFIQEYCGATKGSRKLCDHWFINIMRISLRRTKEHVQLHKVFFFHSRSISPCTVNPADSVIVNEHKLISKWHSPHYPSIFVIEYNELDSCFSCSPILLVLGKWLVKIAINKC